MQENKPKEGGNWKLFLVLAICAAPLIASYFSYYVVKPSGRTNYGDLLDPRQYPIPKLGTTALDGKPERLEDFKGKWIMLQADSGACGDACRRKLLDMRQLRLMQGREMDRIERVWLVLDEQPLDTVLMREYDGTRMLRADRNAARAWLPVDTGTQVEDHIYLIDPLGNLMMRFPKDADPNKMKKDIAKLLKASRIG
ncbi:cytochrome C oxidase subunit I [Oxalobacteraceae bacterium OM1]|nr:cytochrome C oxidase subunit I [Oxalobacteraceae bacterium OM1]